MAAGLGFKDFTTGEVLTAADVDGYLMQGIWVFASNAARDAAVTAPAEGNFAFTKDTNSLWYYDGAAWVASGATGDIEGVTAGVGISGGGTSGTVTVTNSMATAIDAKGDLIGGTGADTFARLAVGANGTVLTAASGETTGLKWETPASGGGYTSLATGSLSGTTTTVNITTTGYKEVRIFIKNLTAAADYNMDVRLNGDSGNNYNFVGAYMSGATTFASQARSASDAFFADSYEATANGYFCFTIFDPANTDAHKIFEGIFTGKNGGNTYNDAGFAQGRYMSNSAITSVSFVTTASASTGTYEIYGVK